MTEGWLEFKGVLRCLFYLSGVLGLVHQRKQTKTVGAEDDIFERRTGIAETSTTLSAFSNIVVSNIMAITVFPPSQLGISRDELVFPLGSQSLRSHLGR